MRGLRTACSQISQNVTRGPDPPENVTGGLDPWAPDGWEPLVTFSDGSGALVTFCETCERAQDQASIHAYPNI